MRRIVVTGLGAVTPLAAGVEAFWSRRPPQGSKVGYAFLPIPGASPSVGFWFGLRTFVRTAR
jgi:3-oxoacyl-(acyl-carrier-protein) synthase